MLNYHCPALVIFGGDYYRYFFKVVQASVRPKFLLDCFDISYLGLLTSFIHHPIVHSTLQHSTDETILPVLTYHSVLWLKAVHSFFHT